jgi:hypothetical protein
MSKTLPTITEHEVEQVEREDGLDRAAAGARSPTRHSASSNALRQLTSAQFRRSRRLWRSNSRGSRIWPTSQRGALMHNSVSPVLGDWWSPRPLGPPLALWSGVRLPPAPEQEGRDALSRDRAAHDPARAEDGWRNRSKALGRTRLHGLVDGKRRPGLLGQLQLERGGRRAGRRVVDDDQRPALGCREGEQA